MSITNTKGPLNKINKNTNDIPWYLWRRFWGILIGSSVLLNILLISKLTSDIKKFLSTTNILDVIKFDLLSVPGSLEFVFRKFLSFKSAGTWFIYIFYITIIILLFLSFKDKKVKIIYPILLLVILLITALGTLSNFVSWI